MGLFNKTPKTISCPICHGEVEKGKFEQKNHWLTHVTVIPDGQGDASGQYTWTCICGPAGLKWKTDEAAAAGMIMHMEQRHGIPM